MSQSRAMVMTGWSSSPNHTLSLTSLTKAVNQYFLHILSLVTDNNPSGIRGREENAASIIS